ncbi:MAG: hypothetical protein AB8G15_11375 [Saprospiraceae bacterium]
MSDSTCLANIAKQLPPYNIPCSQAFCQQVKASLQAFCANVDYPPNAPVLTYDPALNSPCYCCCSGAGEGIPIAVVKNEYVLSEHIKPMDTVLIAGLDLNWRPGKVAAISTAIDASMVPSLYWLEYQMEGEKTTRHILVPVDHLVLGCDKILKKVQTLKQEDELLAADGSRAKVVFVELGIFEKRIQNIELSGAFDGKNLDGHLLNTNGIVSADFKVQAYYAVKEA